MQDWKTLGDLKKNAYQHRSVKQELRENLMAKLAKGEPTFEGILGYEDTVIPQIERAILSGHHILLLGLRGQAKTRIARLITQLLDDFVPAIEGTALNEDPFHPISETGKQIIAEKGDETPIKWIPRAERYTEKLATPDVSVADLIGDLDPIKAATLKLSYSDPRVIHYGLIPRANRGIFVLNELPDLQARIQVSLFNILEEEDIQIRGFKLRLPLDLQFIFTANPEDYTNRGSIITPLKDRIDSQIITHYPKTLEVGKAIVQQEARIAPERKKNFPMPELLQDLIEQTAIEARKSEYVDEKSGVSARMTIAAYETVVSAMERRSICHQEKHPIIARITDLYSAISAITGKVELVYEGEQEGAADVAKKLIDKAIRAIFVTYYPNPESFKKKKEKAENENPFNSIVAWFMDGNYIEVDPNMAQADYEATLAKVSGLQDIVQKYLPKLDQKLLPLMMEFTLHGLAAYSLIGKHTVENDRTTFKDLLSGMFGGEDEEEDFDF